jgi:hypothetical protein
MHLFAQVDMGQISIPSLIAALSGGGFSIWYGWYTTSVTIPRIVTDFREEMRLEREFHDKQIDKLVAHKAGNSNSPKPDLTRESSHTRPQSSSHATPGS